MKKTLVSLMLIVFSTLAIAQGYKVGDIASDFQLKNVDGKTVSMSDYEDAKGIILIFTCNHCPFSVAYEDRINDLNKKYEPKGYPVIAVNPNDPSIVPEDSFENMQKRAREKNFTFPYLFDEGQTVLAKYGATRTPHVYILNNTDKGYRVEYIGAIDNNHQNADAVTEKYVENAVEALRNGKHPDPDFTKAVGCTIKVAQK